MLDTSKKRSEFTGVEIRFEMQFYIVSLSDGKGPLQDLYHRLLLIFCLYLRLIDKRQHNAPGSNARCNRDQLVEILFASRPLRCSAPDKRTVHEPVAAQGRCSDVVLPLESVKLGPAGLRENRVDGASISVVNP